MTALILGADRLGNIPNILKEYGIEDYTHWTGRKKGMRNFQIPCETDMIIVFYDFIEHNITQVVKESAKQRNIPCVFSRRACSDLAKQLNNCVGCSKYKVQ